MKGYLFIKRLDGDIYLPIISLPIYTDREKAYAELMKINHSEIEKLKEWGIFSEKAQETKINKSLIFNEDNLIEDLPLGLYGVIEMRIETQKK